MKPLDRLRQQSRRRQDGIVRRKPSLLDQVLTHTDGDPLVSLHFQVPVSRLGNLPYKLDQGMPKFK